MRYNRRVLLTAVLAEKPSVARDLAAVLGANLRGEGYQHGNGYVVTWAYGHLVALPQPHQVNPEWKAWRAGDLPLLPSRWPLVVQEETAAQYEVVRRILTSDKVDQVICATDAGREGELIFRFLYEATGCKKPVRRLWISSLTPEAIRQGFSALQDSRRFDGLAAAARGRAQADWLVGMNLSRAYTLAQGDTLSVGRVQTPTLAMLVEREREIRGFVPEQSLEVVATFAPQLGAAGVGVGAAASGARITSARATYRGTWFRPKPAEGPQSPQPGDASRMRLRRGDEAQTPARRDRKLPADGTEAKQIVARVLAAGAGAIEVLAVDQKRMPPPLLYDLTELQRHANRLFGFPAQKTLELAQKLYETRKLLSYPRTDSRHISADISANLGGVVAAIAPGYAGLLAPGTGERPLGKRFVDDAKVSDHHALLPTTTDPRGANLPPDEQRLYDLVCRRLLSAWHGDHVWSVTTVITAVASPGAVPARAAASATALVIDRFHTTGAAVDQPGWKVLDVQARGGEARARKAPASRREGAERTDERDADPPEADDQDLPSGLARGQRQAVTDAAAEERVTRPPKRLTDATLLTAMETAGKTLDDQELSRAMQERGLGTPSTRAAIIETLLTREYVVREGRALAATEKGMGLIDRVHADVKSPAMTGEWESQLRRIEGGQAELGGFLSGIEAYVREVVGRALAGGVAPRSWPGGDGGARGAATATAPRMGERSIVAKSTNPATALLEGVAVRPRPAPGTSLGAILKDTFGHPRFRPHQEEVCTAALEGKDLLLVMPTGAGKSLCYQLPGLARGGTTLVVSPLIALMEDQVGKLRALGLRAHRIHSGRDRAESRAVCQEYLAGNVDFLYVAPERLGVPGFLELLARKKPGLIAIDEAHCISHWGHDFRPEYRRLGERLPMLRPAPVLALTATATPLVQDDICAQLGLQIGLQKGRRFIHGFRRTNLALEVVLAPKPERPAIVRALLRDPARRPAILYAPSRKDAEALAETLAQEFPAAAYHAGMTPAVRERVQTGFLSGALEVVVATIAFGMGVDKADVRTVAHLALPRTVEGYYQEIGRAGRDGKPARAVLLHSFVDRKTIEFLRERSYPDPEVLAQLFKKLSLEGEPREELARRIRKLEPEVFERALEKLSIHGGAHLVGDTVRRGHERWRPGYEKQLAHQLEQEEQMAQFTKGHGCRMLHLVRHFGDEADAGLACGQCDACAPDACVVQAFREPSPVEQQALRRVLETLARCGELATGTLWRESQLEGTLDRRGFEVVLSGLVRSRQVAARDDEFVKDGKRIAYQRVSLTASGRAAGPAALPRLPTLEALEEADRPRRKKKGRGFFARGGAAKGRGAGKGGGFGGKQGAKAFPRKRRPKR